MRFRWVHLVPGFTCPPRPRPLEATGRSRTALLRATELPNRFPGTVQAVRALRKRGELLERLRGEVGDQLRSLHGAHQSFFQEKDRYETDLRKVWWIGPPGRPAYTYGFLEPCNASDAGTPQVTLTSDPAYRSSPGVSLDVSEMSPFSVASVRAVLAAKGLTATASCLPPPQEQQFLAVAVSNLDADEQPDVWVVFITGAVERVFDDLE